MEIKSAYSSGVLSIQRGMQGLERNAAALASADRMNKGEAPPVGPLVDSKVNQQQAEVGAKVISTADKMLGSLLDIKA